MELPKILGKVKALLAKRGQKTELSHQAEAVIEVLAEEIADYLKAQKSGHMKHPKIEEVLLQGAKIGLSEKECQKFFSYYESISWTVAGRPMKVWKAALTGWKLRNEEKATEASNKDDWRQSL